MTAIAIIPRPADWQPQSVHDVPPGFEWHYEPRCAAPAYAHRFNELELADASGYWCVIVPDVQAFDAEPIDWCI